MHPLFDYIKRYAKVSEAEFEVILSHVRQKKLRKKQYLLQEGQVCQSMAFIIKGAMRKCYIDEKGVEHVVELYVENWWAGDRQSFVMNTPTHYNIDATEDCELLLLSRESSLKLSTQCPAFNEMVLKLDERNAISSQTRITSSISFTAEKRYADFVGRHPYFVQRFPQHLIASYLGITKDTLSRVRKKALKP
jgi:CRP-like cAMP-binding protein